jgi:class 3 adenylate cyclase
MIGILAFQFPIDRITEVMTGNFGWKREGLGETGEVYLVGPDFTMRTRSRFMVEHRAEFLKTLRESGVAAHIVDRIERQGNVLLALPVRTPPVERALQGKEGIEISRGYRDVPVVTAYGPIELDSLRWAVIAGMDSTEAYAPALAFGRKVLATGVGVALVVSLLALLWSHSLVRPIRALADGVRRVASDRLDVQVHVDTQDEFRELADAFNEMTRKLKANADQLEQKVRENEELLLNILPASAAARMQEGDGQSPQSFNDVTVLFADLVGLDALSETLGEDTSLVMLQDLVGAFDEAAERFGVEKVKTVGSSYMAVCGLSVQRPDHTSRTIEFAQELIRIVQRFNRERGTQLVVEIGVNAGPVVGGVVGRKKFIYDLWGDTVTIARGLGSDGVTSIQITASVYERVRDLYPFESLGEVEIQGKGRIPTWTSKAEPATELS